jgi:hypothetical protein
MGRVCGFRNFAVESLKGGTELTVKFEIRAPVSCHRRAKLQTILPMSPPQKRSNEQTIKTRVKTRKYFEDRQPWFLLATGIRVIPPFNGTSGASTC